jgi:hypothetical protein
MQKIYIEFDDASLSDKYSDDSIYIYPDIKINEFENNDYLDVKLKNNKFIFYKNYYLDKINGFQITIETFKNNRKFDVFIANYTSEFKITISNDRVIYN